jgi:hypothetical protein
MAKFGHTYVLPRPTVDAPHLEKPAVKGAAGVGQRS